MTDAVSILRGLEELYPELQFIDRLRDSIERFPTCNWEDAMSRGQITSKQWIIHQLIMMEKANLGKVVICGGWLGILSRMLMDSPDIHSHFIDSIDLDNVACLAAINLNSDHPNNHFRSYAEDMRALNYDQYDTIINTSCEHVSDFDSWMKRIPKNRFVILQSNNFTESEDHVNCVRNAWELAEQANLSNVTYSGFLQCIKYKRYMVMGVK